MHHTLTSTPRRPPAVTNSSSTVRRKSPAPPAFSLSTCSCGGDCPRCQPASRFIQESNNKFLPTTLLSEFEPRFGADFSQVRVHTDHQADTAAQNFGARAFAHGHDLFFSADAYAPATPEGRELIAHELAHVVQQSETESSSDSQKMTAPGDAVENEADRAATTVLSGGRLGKNTLRSTGLQVARKAIDCVPNPENYPLLWSDQNAPARSTRPASGHAQKRLNIHLKEVEKCRADATCWATVTESARAFIDAHWPLLTRPLAVDCQFGPQSERATKIVQAFFFKDPKEWDGKIGPQTWNAIDNKAYNKPDPAPLGPTIPLPNAPIPPKPGPIFL